MVRMHPITLQFDDKDMERELRSGTVDASRCALILFGILDVLCRVLFPVIHMIFDPRFDTYIAVVISCTCIAMTWAVVLYLLRCSHTRRNAATFQDRLWMIAWVANSSVWWVMQQCGMARRLTAAEGQSAAVTCAMWGFVMVLQHALHIGFRYRVVVMMLATSIAVTSVAWRKELLAALTFGEAIGYTMEHMKRSSYLPSTTVLKQRREEAAQLLSRPDVCPQDAALSAGGTPMQPPTARRDEVELEAGSSGGGSHLQRTARGGLGKPACTADQVRDLASHALRFASGAKTAVAKKQLCALCGAEEASHTLLPCLCSSVCEPCGKLKIFRYDLPVTMIQDLATRPHCPACRRPVECMIALRPEERRLHFSIKLPAGASITID